MTDPVNETPAEAKQPTVWSRLLKTRGARIELAAFAASALLLTGLAFQIMPATADAQKLEGDPVPPVYVPAIVAAAGSCTALNPPRVAAQVMVLSGFGEKATGKDIAGMSDAEWKKSMPSSTSQRTDPGANIVALGHHLCQLIGQVRGAKVKGDPWLAALAADQVGLQAVVEAGGVPAAAEPYVDKVQGYANWYKDQDVFRPEGEERAARLPSGKGAVEVPAELVSDINAAGRICPTVTPARVAAQLSAVSAFDPNIRSVDGAGGIAMFSPQLWDQYRPSKTATPWETHDAIPALGSAMCDMSNQLVGLGGDAWKLALCAFQWSPKVVRQAGGQPRVNVPQLAEIAAELLPAYEKDGRLTAKPAPKSPPSSVPPSSAAPSASATVPEPAPNKPEVAYDPNAKYQLQNVWAGAVLELPGDDDPAITPGTHAQLWEAGHGSDQYWRIEPAPDPAYVIITNDFRNLSLAMENQGTDNDVKLVVADRNPADESQQWQLSDAGEGQIRLLNRHSGKVLDLLGDDVSPPENENTMWNGSQIGQWDLQEAARDQRWLLLAS